MMSVLYALVNQRVFEMDLRMRNSFVYGKESLGIRIDILIREYLVWQQASPRQ